MEEFRREVLSGDHYRIQQALQRASKAAQAAFIAQPEGQALGSPESQPRQLFIGLVAVAVVVVAAAAAVVEVGAGALGLAVAVDAVVYLQLAIVDGSGSGTTDGDCINDCETGSDGAPLVVDELVDDLAEVAVPIWAWQPISAEPGYGVEGHTYYTSSTPKGLRLADVTADGIVDRIYYEVNNDRTDLVDIVTGADCAATSCVPEIVEGYPDGAVPMPGDYNGDGFDDILWWSFGDLHEIWYFAAGGSHSVSLVAHATTEGSSVYYQPFAGDFDGNGIDDLLWYGTEDRVDEIWLGSTTGTFTALTLPPMNGFRQVVIGKFLPGVGDDILFYDGGGTFPSPHPLWDLEPTGVPNQLLLNNYLADQRSGFIAEAADVNADGRDDIYWYFGHAVQAGTGVPVDGPDDTWIWIDDTLSFQTLTGPGPGRDLFPEIADLDENSYPDFVWWPYAGRNLPEPPPNTAPEAVCANVPLAAGASCTATVTKAQVDGGSFDPDGDDFDCELNTVGPFGLSGGTVTLTCTDSLGSSDSCVSVITVTDTTPPVLNCPAGVNVSCTNANGGVATFAPDATDNCGVGIPTCALGSGANFPLGTTGNSCTTTDTSGNSSSCVFDITVALADNPVCCPAGTNVMLGTSNNDTLSGTSGADCILGRGSQDTINGNAGNDWISGGDGDDIISGGTGNDRVFGGSGQDLLSGNAGNDVMSGGDGDDQCFGGTEDDALLGGQGQDRLYGEAGNDALIGESGDDRLEGGDGNDSLNGSGLHDVCLGGPGTDVFLVCESQTQ